MSHYKIECVLSVSLLECNRAPEPCRDEITTEVMPAVYCTYTYSQDNLDHHQFF